MPPTVPPPGPRGLPILGNLLPYARDPLAFLTRCAREFGDVVKLSIGTWKLFVLYHPDHIESVLRSNHRAYIKDKLTRRLSGLVGEGLLTSEGDFWRRQRQLAQPAFALTQVQQYVPSMLAATQRLLDSWSDGQPRDLHADMGRLALEIVAKVLFNADTTAQAEQVSGALDFLTDYYLSPLALSNFYQRLPTPRNIRFRRAVRRLDDILYGIVRERRESGKDVGDLLSRLLAARDGGGGMSDKQLRDELVTLFLAGHETTALVLSYAFYLLATHPEAEARWLEEIDRELAGRPPTAADLSRLSYTEWVVRESMRLYPPAWSIGREAVEETEVGGFRVPPGTQMWLIQWVVHRDPRWYDRPEEFRPERWDDDLIKRLPRGAYFPFGDGPRICIGSTFAMMEATLILAAVAQRFRVEVAPGFALKLTPSVTLRPKGGVKLIVRQRHPDRETVSVPTREVTTG